MLVVIIALSGGLPGFREEPHLLATPRRAVLCGGITGRKSKWLPRKTGVSGWRSRSGYLGKLILGGLWHSTVHSAAAR